MIVCGDDWAKVFSLFCHITWYLCFPFPLDWNLALMFDMDAFISCHNHIMKNTTNTTAKPCSPCFADKSRGWSPFGHQVNIPEADHHKWPELTSQSRFAMGYNGPALIEVCNVRCINSAKLCHVTSCHVRYSHMGSEGVDGLHIQRGTSGGRKISQHKLAFTHNTTCHSKRLLVMNIYSHTLLNIDSLSYKWQKMWHIIAWPLYYWYF